MAREDAGVTDASVCSSGIRNPFAAAGLTRWWIMSMYSLVFFASMPVGYGQAGLVTHAFGAQAALQSSGIVATCIGLGCVLLLRPVRALR